MLVQTDVCEAMNPCQNGGTCVANGTIYYCEFKSIKSMEKTWKRTDQTAVVNVVMHIFGNNLAIQIITNLVKELYMLC